MATSKDRAASGRARMSGWAPPPTGGQGPATTTGSSARRAGAARALPLIGHWPAKKQYWAAGGALAGAVALALAAQGLSWQAGSQADAFHEQSLRAQSAVLRMQASGQALARGQAGALETLGRARQDLSDAAGQIAFGPFASAPGADGQALGNRVSDAWRLADSQGRSLEGLASVAQAWAPAADKAQQQAQRLAQALAPVAQQAGAGGASAQALVVGASSMADGVADAAARMSQRGLGASGLLEPSERDAAAIEQSLAAASDASGGSPALRQAIEQARPLARALGQSLSQLAQATPGSAQGQQAVESLNDTPLAIGQALAAFDGPVGAKRSLAGWESVFAALMAVTALGALALLAAIHSCEKWSQGRQARGEQREAQAQINRLLDEIDALAQGDLTARATSGGEFTSAIADSVNFAIGQLSQLARQIQAAAGDMGGATERAQETLGELGELNQAQAQSAREASESAIKLTTSIKSAAQAMEGSEQIAKRTQDLSKEGVATVSAMAHNMESIAEGVEETAKRMRRLKDTSRQIAQILDLITELGEQTSVLSLNATVQANKAGAAGQGFRVVADAVQKLAERANRATGQIGQLIRGAQTDIQEAFDATLRAAEHTESGQETSRSAKRVFEELAKSGAELAGVVEKSHDSVDAGSRLARELAAAAERLRESVGESDHAWGRVGEDVGRVGRERERLLHSVEGFKIE
jgi:twitching motility protein PilJ